MRRKNFPIENLRKMFPALNLKERQQVFPIYFDGPGGTQMTQACIDRMLEYISTGMANLHGTFPTSKKTDALLAEARSSVGYLLNCRPREVAFGQNMTSLAFQLSHSLRALIQPGDEIVVTELDHRANVDPWLVLAKETAARIRFIPVNKETYTLDLSDLDQLITTRTRLVAVGISSNLTGTVSDVATIFSKAREAGAITIADAVHAVPHMPIDFQALACDILFCSAYKFFGPHLGIAVIRAPLFEKLEVNKLEPAPADIPSKLETGTQNHEAIAGLCGTIDFIRSLGEGENPREQIRSAMESIAQYEQGLMQALQEFLRSIPEVQLYRPPETSERTPTFAFRISGMNSREAAAFFADKYNLCVGDGHFYASTMAKLFPVMDTGGWIRIGLAPYNTMEEIDLFKRALKDLISMHP